MRLIIAALLIGPMLLTGCARAPYTIQAHLDPDELAWANQQGTGTIMGQAFMKTVGGDVKTCAGNTVQLVPASAYTREMTAAARAGASAWANRDPRLTQYIRSTKCDAQGNFSFNAVPGG